MKVTIKTGMEDVAKLLGDKSEVKMIVDFSGGNVQTLWLEVAPSKTGNDEIMKYVRKKLPSVDSDRFKPIRVWLKKDYAIAQQDRIVMEDWRRHRFTTRNLKKHIFENNRFPEGSMDVISDELFEEWLATIGWER